MTFIKQQFFLGMLYAPAQPRKGFIYGHSKKIIHEHL